MSKSRVLFVGGLTLAASLALAASPVGSWTGKVIAKMPPIPATATPQQKAMMQQGMAMAAKIRIMLNLKADKTFTVTVGGLPNGAPQKPESGKWSQKGNIVTTTSTKMGKAQSLMLSADGKTMTLDTPGGQGKVVFTR